MTKLVLNNRRFFLISVILFILAYGKLDLHLKYLPIIILILYTILLEIFTYKKKFKYSWKILFSITDSSFITWAIYHFDNDFFIIFYIFLIFALRYRNGFDKGLIIFFTTLMLFYLISLFRIDWTQMLWNQIIIQLIIKPLVFIFTLLIANKILRFESKRKKEFLDLEKQLKMKNNILSTLSHELKTPLTMIKTSAEIILEGRPGKINKKQKYFLDIIVSNVLRLKKIIENILARIKIESTWLKLDLNLVDLRPIIKQVINNMKPIIEQNNQTLKYIHPKLISKVRVDKNWIQQVMINLIYNASKHVGENGRIITSLKENEQCLVVSVSDDGSGIENIRKPRIFTEYYRSDDILASTGDGTGLGLAIVKYVVEKHKGKIYVGSVPGIGTTFSFTLPKAERK